MYCYAVAREFWVVVDVLLGCSKRLLTCCYAVARVF